MLTLQLLGWYINPIQHIHTRHTHACIIAIIKSSTLHIPVQLPSDSRLCPEQQYASQARFLLYRVLYRGELVDLQRYIIIYYVMVHNNCFTVSQFALYTIQYHCNCEQYIFVMEAYVHNYSLAS